jgi:hypothetical protein
LLLPSLEVPSVAFLWNENLWHEQDNPSSFTEDQASVSRLPGLFLYGYVFERRYEDWTLLKKKK